MNDGQNNRWLGSPGGDRLGLPELFQFACYVYHAAGCPYGPTEKGMMIWVRQIVGRLSRWMTIEEWCELANSNHGYGSYEITGAAWF